MPTLHRLVKGVTVLYHESTYTTEYARHASLYYHSTAAQAAQVARDAQVGELVLGHYSARFEDESVLLSEARAVFDHTILSNEGLVIDVG